MYAKLCTLNVCSTYYNIASHNIIIDKVCKHYNFATRCLAYVQVRFRDTHPAAVSDGLTPGVTNRLESPVLLFYVADQIVDTVPAMRIMGFAAFH